MQPSLHCSVKILSYGQHVHVLYGTFHWHFDLLLYTTAGVVQN